ncbi:hypothetical protein Xinn_02305 [Xenorhabdus innexi]|uniref:Transposase n=1 Tax=Xenorhabdus innexi TaxID=290109 RepID=A0A2G0NFS9_9GAMM|nr:hypothetical protein Xinn_02305 [Xenorhabdus innexi]
MTWLVMNEFATNYRALQTYIQLDNENLYSLPPLF